jgi:glycosyltransferase involved in cell wall biosynthesis
MYQHSGRDQLRDDLLVSNSNWVASFLSKLEIASPVIYPPVPLTSTSTNWQNRRSDFVWIGRLAPSKRVESAITIVGLLRAAGETCKLDIIGNAIDNKYGTTVKTLAKAAGNWVTLIGPLYGAEKEQYIGQFRYALHTRADEPFGLTVAELIKSGCVVFGPNSSGSAEILDHEDLVFRSEEEAVAKILTVMEDPLKLETIRRHLEMRANCFSTDTFQNSVRSLIADFLEEGPSSLTAQTRCVDESALAVG